ncbi:MAG: protein kinase [Rhodanobacteraceae bacterium]|nr:protein kinase [Rhodanobacteraceae bacterium]
MLLQSDHRTSRVPTLTERFDGAVVAMPSRRSGPVRPGAVHGRYEVLALLGSGGMGKVYLARDIQLDRKVALKLLSGKLTRNGEWLRRFVREARAISALNHPNIITVHEVGEFDGHHYIATEHIEGQSLRARLLEGPLTPAVALEIAVQLCSALMAAHSAGIVHRDIKPENIMLRPDGWLKLLDFGLAKPLAASDPDGVDTIPGVVRGTASYMSPEQARGQPVDARSDLFSLGVLLYEMLAGATPFAGATASDVIAAVLERQPLPLSQRVAGLPGELDALVARCLRKERELRPASAAELLPTLKQLQRELEARARPGAEPDARTTADAAAALLLSNPPAAPRHSTSLDSEAAFEIPEVRYALSGEVNIAWQAIGTGPIDLVFVMGWISHLEYFWTEPSFARFLRRLAGFARVILFDKRGTGLSDRVPPEQLPTLEQRMDDVRAVMEAAGCQRAVLCARLRGRADVQPVRRHLSRAHRRAGDDGQLCAAPALRGLSLGPHRGAARCLPRRDPHSLGRPGRTGGARSRHGQRPRLPRLVGRLPATRREPGRCGGADPDEQRDRHPPCAAERACAHPGVAPQRRPLPAGRGRALPGREHPWRALRRVAGRGPSALRRRAGRVSRRDRGVPHRRAPRLGVRSRARHRAGGARIRTGRRCRAPVAATDLRAQGDRTVPRPSVRNRPEPCAGQLRRPRARDPRRLRDPYRRAAAGRGTALRIAHRRMRCDRRTHGRNRRGHRARGGTPGRTRRGAGLRHGQGSRRRLRPAFPRPRPRRPAGRAGGVAGVWGGAGVRGERRARQSSKAPPRLPPCVAAKPVGGTGRSVACNRRANNEPSCPGAR